MICKTCKHESSNIRINSYGIESCSNCGGYGETSGVRTDKIITRNSDRVKTQQMQGEGEMITPWVWDKNQSKLIVNDDFIKLYPEQSRETFNELELKESGNELLDQQEDKEVEVDDVEFSGKLNIEEIVK